VEFQHALDHDYYAFVINDELNRAVNEVDAIARGEVAPEQAAIRESVWQLLNELKRKLYS
jgi:guanylate kinase